MQRGAAGEIITARFAYQPGTLPVADSGVAIAHGRIVQRGSRDDLKMAFPDFRAVHYEEQILLPAYVNAHTHLELTDFPLWSPDSRPTSFVDWILNLIKVKRGLGVDAYRIAREHGYQESLRAGTGYLGDIVTWSEPAHLDQPEGLKLLRFYELLGREGEQFLARCGTIAPFLDVPNTGISPHAPYTLDSGTLRQSVELARNRGMKAMMHLAESAAELQLFVDGGGEIAERLYPAVNWPLDHSKIGTTPLGWIDASCSSTNGLIMVHGVHLTDTEIEMMGERQIPLVLCSRSNETLGVGLPKVEQLLRVGVPLALGTDSRASAPSLSIRDEMVYCHRHWPDINPDLWLQMATTRGGEMLFPGQGAASLMPESPASLQLIRIPLELTGTACGEYLCSDDSPESPDHLYLQGREVR